MLIATAPILDKRTADTNTHQQIHTHTHISIYSHIHINTCLPCISASNNNICACVLENSWIVLDGCICMLICTEAMPAVIMNYHEGVTAVICQVEIWRKEGGVRNGWHRQIITDGGRRPTQHSDAMTIPRALVQTPIQIHPLNTTEWSQNTVLSPSRGSVGGSFKRKKRNAKAKR